MEGNGFTSSNRFRNDLGFLTHSAWTITKRFTSLVLRAFLFTLGLGFLGVKGEFLGAAFLWYLAWPFIYQAFTKTVKIAWWKRPKH